MRAGVVGRDRQRQRVAEVLQHLGEVLRAEAHVVGRIFRQGNERGGGAELLRHRLRGERHELHQAARTGRADRADVEAALLADDAESERRVDCALRRFGGDRPTG
jgi:hypothetical protein